jgi:hypothetical protein
MYSLCHSHTLSLSHVQEEIPQKMAAAAEAAAAKARAAADAAAAFAKAEAEALAAIAQHVSAPRPLALKYLSLGTKISNAHSILQEAESKAKLVKLERRRAEYEKRERELAQQEAIALEAMQRQKQEKLTREMAKAAAEERNAVDFIDVPVAAAAGAARAHAQQSNKEAKIPSTSMPHAMQRSAPPPKWHQAMEQRVPLNVRNIANIDYASLRPDVNRFC